MCEQRLIHYRFIAGAMVFSQCSAFSLLMIICFVYHPPCFHPNFLTLALICCLLLFLVLLLWRALSLKPIKWAISHVSALSFLPFPFSKSILFPVRTRIRYGEECLCLNKVGLDVFLALLLSFPFWLLFIYDIEKRILIFCFPAVDVKFSWLLHLVAKRENFLCKFSVFLKLRSRALNNEKRKDRVRMTSKFRFLFLLL